VIEDTSRTTKVLVSTIVAVRTFSSVPWRTGVLLPWRRAPVKNSRSGPGGGSNRKSSAADRWQSDRWHNQAIGDSRQLYSASQ